jgi:hypothetical protein
MAMRMPAAVLLTIILVNGCHSRDFIARNATQQTTTVNDILQQQMLDNLAIFAKNKDALPSFELALTYQKRLKKVGSKLFTFLDYDGVPWNNNGAEHAVKSFMKFKRTSDGLFSERSLTEALVMLSIFETCKLNDVKRLRFLLSGKTDLASILGE